jgi:hypothetical protein
MSWRSARLALKLASRSAVGSMFFCATERTRACSNGLRRQLPANVPGSSALELQQDWIAAYSPVWVVASSVVTDTGTLPSYHLGYRPVRSKRSSRRNARFLRHLARFRNIRQRRGLLPYHNRKKETSMKFALVIAALAIATPPWQKKLVWVLALGRRAQA